MHSNRLYMDYSASKLSAGEYIIIECYRKLDPTDMTDIYNDMWLKKYATALVKYQWGENLSKFQGIALPGGVTLDGSAMKQEAQEEITKLEEESRLNMFTVFTTWSRLTYFPFTIAPVMYIPTSE